MSIMIKLFLLLYLLAIVLVTILGVVWMLTGIVKLEWATRKTLLMKHQNKST